MTPANLPNKPTILTDGKQLTTASDVKVNQIIAKTTAAPEVKTLETAQLTQALQVSRVEDHTFTQTVSIDKSATTGSTLGLTNLNLPPINLVNVNLPPPQNSGLPGSFSPSIIPNSINTLPPGSPVNVKVVFNK